MATVTQKGTSVTPIAANAFVQGGPSPAYVPHTATRFYGIAGETIAAGDACYIKTSDGLVYKVPTALNTPYHGVALEQSREGHPITLGHSFVMDYAASAQNINAPLYLSGTTAGKLDASATSNGARVACVVPKPGAKTDITTSTYIYVFPPMITAGGGGAGSTLNTYTQTYSTANRTVAAPTAATITDNSGGAAANGTIEAITTFTPSVAWDGATVYPSAADATAIAAAITALMAAVKELSTAVNACIADDLDNRQTLTALIDDLQAAGIVA